MAAKDLGKLPNWDLTHLYKSLQDPQIEKDFKAAEQAADDFAKNYQTKVADLDGNALAKAITEYEHLSELLHKIGSYAYLNYATQTDNSEAGQFKQTVQERSTDIGTKTVFFTLEINKIEDDALATKLDESDDLQRYKPFLDDVRDSRPYQLSDEVEMLLHEKSVTGRSAWTRLFNESVADLRFNIDGEDLTETEALNLLSDADADKRKAAADAVGKVFNDNIRLFALITNTLAKDKEIMDRKRGYKSPMAARNISNQVEDAVVEALVDSVTKAFPRTAHRYFRLKAKWLGKDKLQYWDRNAPLPTADDRKIPWAEAENIVLDAFNAFSPEIGDITKRFFDENWIDAPVKTGKRGGAFAHYTVPSVHPYVMMNYQGKVRDVMTLAHELGHGVHGYLGNPHGLLMAHTPLTLAETASVFGEMLVFQNLLKSTQDKNLRKAMLASKVEDMLNTVVRQIAFHHYEVGVHTGRKKGELLPEQISEIWMQTQKQSLGDAFDFRDDYKAYWAYIPHFLHTPFYVYAYAFGDCLVNSLYAVYEQSDPAEFAVKYKELLAAGGTKRHKDLLAPFGLNATDPDFWDKGLGLIERLIDELETLE